MVAEKRIHILSLGLCTVCWLVFVMALTYPALKLRAPNGNIIDWPSLECLVWGPLGLFGVLDGRIGRLSWLANPLLLLTTVTMSNRQYGKALVCSLMAMMVGLLAFLPLDIWLDEAGTPGIIVSHERGFYLWMFALGLNLLSSFVVWWLATNFDPNWNSSKLADRSTRPSEIT